MIFTPQGSAQPRPQRRYRRIVLLRWGAAGDVLMLGPAIAQLAAAQPEAELILCTTARYADLQRHNPHLRQVLAFAKPLRLRAIARALADLQPDAVLDLNGKLRGALLQLAFAPRILRGQTAWLRWRGIGLRERLPLWLGRPYQPRFGFEARYSAAVARLLDNAPLAAESLAVYVPPASFTYAEKFMAELKPQGPLIALVPGANWQTKRWPPRHFVQLARSLLQAQASVVWCGGPQEEALLNQLQAATPSSALFPASASLMDMGALFTHAAAVVTHDSAPLHLSRALGCKTVLLAGSTSVAQFAAPHVRIVQRPLPCNPCSTHGRQRCPLGHQRCLVGMSPAQVYAQLLEMGVLS